MREAAEQKVESPNVLKEVDKGAKNRIRTGFRNVMDEQGKTRKAQTGRINRAGSSC